MSLQNTLITKLENFEPVEILRKIGYRKITDKTLSRLKNALASDYLGLDRNDFDFKYSNIEFIKALCEFCAVDINQYQDEINNLIERISRLKHGFNPYVFVYTGFKRSSQPIFSLAVMEGRRHLYLPNEYKLENLDSQIEFVKKMIIDHYNNENGVLLVWGEIKNYVFNATENRKIVFDPAGNFVDIKTCSQNIAKMTLKNKDITKLLNK